jgi:hypothetical protein
MGTSSGDAVDKSSISWACGGRKAEKERVIQDKITKKKSKLEEEKRKLKAKEEAWDNIKQKLKTELPENQLNALSEHLKVVRTDLEKVTEELDHLVTPTNMKDLDLPELPERLENEFWKDKFRLSLLIRAGAKAQRYLTKSKLKTWHCDETLECYACIGPEGTEALFGRPFKELLEVV